MLSKETQPGVTSAQIGVTLTLTAFFVILFIFYQNQFFGLKTHTINLHLNSAVDMFYGEKSAPKSKGGYHYSVGIVTELLSIAPEYAGILILSIANVAITLIFFQFIKHHSNDSFSTGIILLFTFLVLFSGAITLPFWKPGYYDGKGLISPLHNSTFIFSRPFYLLGFILTIPLIDQPLAKTWRKVLLVGAIYLAATFGKPNAILVIIPAIGIWLLLTRLTNLNSYLIAFFIFLPSVGLLLFQFLNIFTTGIHEVGGGGRTIALDYFNVWFSKTNNLSGYILSIIAFPLVLAIFRYEKIKNSPVLSISWLIFLFAILQKGMLVEVEFPMSGNWSWGHLYALNFLFLFSAAELLLWLREQNENKIELVGKYICLVLFTLHVASGIAFLYIHRNGYG